MFEPVPAVLLEDDYLKKIHREGSKGVIVIDVVAGGPADKAGVVEGDVLLKYNGEAVPIPADLDPKDPEGSGDSFNRAFSKLTDKVKAGAKLTYTVERDGKEMTLEGVAVGDEQREKIQQVADEQGGVPDVPALKTAGIPAAGTFSFEKVAADKVRPDDCVSLVGQWEVVEDEGAATANHVLKQSAPLETEGFCLVAGHGHAYANATVSVRVRMDAGGDDASGGLFFRAKDHRSHYMARIAAKDGQFRLLVAKDGHATTLASASAPTAKVGGWHTISVTMSGPSLKATLDGSCPLEATDKTYASGWTGLWTKGAAVTSFDDWKATPSK